MKTEKQKTITTTNLVLLGMMTGVLLLMAYTPLGYLNIGPLAISFNMIPVAITAIALGPVGGLITGSVFGLTSFLQCIGVGGVSAMGAILFQINPFLAFIQRFVPRALDGLLLGYIFQLIRARRGSLHLASAVTGFIAAVLNTLFFMSMLVLLFGNTEYMQNLIGGRNIIAFICAFVGINAVVEMFSATVITALVATALVKARLMHPAEIRGAHKAVTV